MILLRVSVAHEAFAKNKCDINYLSNELISILQVNIPEGYV